MFIWPCIVRNFFLIKPTDVLIFPNLFLSRNSACFGQFLCPSSGVLHCTFGTGIRHAGLMTDFKHVQEGTHLSSSAECTVENSWVPSWTCLKAVIKIAWHLPVPNVQWRTPDDGQRNCPKRVEFLDKINLEKLVGLLVLFKKKKDYR